MEFPHPLLPATLVRRYKRFLADIRLEDGTEATAHCPNSGAMLGLNAPGSRVWVADHRGDPKRKLPFALELVEADGGPVGINTMMPNRLVAEALAANLLDEFGAPTKVRREVPYAERSRVDFLLERDGEKPLYLEIKNVHLRRPERGDGLDAEFPDCVTARGARHMADLAHVAQAGEADAALLFVVQRTDCQRVRLAQDLDPGYAAAFAAARAAGVAAYARACDISPSGISLAAPLPVLDPLPI